MRHLRLPQHVIFFLPSYTINQQRLMMQSIYATKTCVKTHVGDVTKRREGGFGRGYLLLLAISIYTTLFSKSLTVAVIFMKYQSSLCEDDDCVICYFISIGR